MAKRERLAPAGKRVYHLYPYDQDATYGSPAWRVIEFWKHVGTQRYLVARFVYDTLEHAENARIIARAFANYTMECNARKASWAGFARRIDYIHTPKGQRPRASIGDAVSAKIYRNIQNGSLPKDPAVRQRIFDLAGYPWKD